ncbi:TonB-dependent receptor plug domain-containing protein [Agitococcus lubricus]|uniref:Iron complex outermembrane receptor protein n=1 Tax=Agitococcus lubricus TaxID=1077255 RepID=A0A2T5J2R8_9GAMM|nr:TonB-dependent receptor [Agitococcus lubricus]PTQ90823.1 iron complex outermembrane receptor protein [Agitococcus lubricus]
MKKLVLAIAILSAFDSASAEDLLFADQDMPVVLSATRLKQALADAPASVTIIDRQMIQQTGVRELPELLRLVPGMVVGYEKGWEAFVSYHGTSADMARRMQVLIDGRSVFQPSLAFVDWIGLPLELEDIDRIEVVRGPNAAAYGANSFLAVVNIITRAPADLPTVRAYTRQGSGGINDNFVSYAGVNNQFSWQLSANQRNDNGYSTFFKKETARDANGEKIFDKDGNAVKVFNPYPYADDKRQKSVYGQLVMETENDGVAKIAFGHSEMLAGEDSETEIVQFLEDPDIETSQNYLNLDLEHNVKNHKLQFQANYSEFNSKQHIRVAAPPEFFLPELRQMFVIDRIFTKAFMDGELGASENDELMGLAYTVLCKLGHPAVPEPLCQSLQATKDDFLASDQELIYGADIDKRETRIELELQDTWSISPSLRLVYGAGLQDSRADSQHYFNGKVENTVWRVFAHGEWEFRPDWRLNVGMMDEHDDYAGHLQSPRVALNWRFLPTHSLRLVTSKAYRTPDLRESKAYWQFYGQAEDRQYSARDGYFPYLGQAPVKGQETCVFSKSYDDGTLVCTNGAPSERIVSREIGYYGEIPAWHLQTDIRVFHDHLELSEHNLEIDDFVIAPLKKHEQRGVELSTQWRPHANWRFMLNYAYDDMSFNNDNNDFVPLHSGNVAAWYDSQEGIQSSVSYVFYNQLYNDYHDGGLYFDRLDLRMAKKWSLHKRQDLELSGVWQIRLTEDNELRRENGAPRDRMWLGLTYTYD